MSRRTTGLLLMVVAASGWLFVSAGAARAQETEDTKLEQDTFALINQYRLAEGMPAFTWNVEVAAVARAHSRDMATGAVDFGHNGFHDRSAKLKQALPGMDGCGENVLETSYPTGLAQSAVALWLKSPRHRENIRGKYQLSGIGVWRSPGGVVYFTQIFVRVSAVPATESGEL